MNEDREDKLNTEVKEIWSQLKDSVNEVQLKQLNIKQLERILLRLETLSESCEQCAKYQRELLEYGRNLFDNREHIDKNTLKYHSMKVHEIINHLQKEHKLVTEGYYLAIYMPLGLSIGVVFGTLLNHTPIGLSLGLVFGVAIGNYLDSEAKKKGNVV